MSIIDVDVLLQDVGTDAPSGPNLEYDPAFLELEQSTLGKPEVQYGTTIVPATPPEWKDVKRQALELFKRTQDLRVAMPLVRALLAIHALPGFADGLRLIERLVDERWDSVHPALDPDDGNDPMQRLNALAALTDSATLLRELRDTAFIQLPSLGTLSVRVLDQISGDLPVPKGQSVPTIESIQAALQDVPADILDGSATAAGAALASVIHLETVLMRQVGSSQALDLAPMTRQLRRIHDLLASGQAQAAALAPAGADATGADAAVQPGPGSTPAAISGDINSRTDVLRMLDKILAYYQRNEPSSPVPLLLERAKRLAPKSFLEILQDLAPDGMSQLKVIRGPLPEEQNK